MKTFNAEDILQAVLSNSHVRNRAVVVGTIVVALSGTENGMPPLNGDPEALAVLDAVVRDLIGSTAKPAEAFSKLQAAWRKV